MLHLKNCVFLAEHGVRGAERPISEKLVHQGKGFGFPLKPHEISEVC